MIVTIADQYLAQNAGRRYPLADDTVGVPDNVILDFRCSVRMLKDSGMPSAKLKSITGATAKTVTVSVYAGDEYVCDLSFAIKETISKKVPYTTTAASGNVRGEITVTSAILSVTYEAAPIPFAKTTVVADSLKVDSVQSVFTVESGDSYKTKLTGEIVITGGYNTDPYLDGNKLHLDIDKGNGIGEWCQTAAVGQTCDNVMFSINGEKPGSDGEIRLVGTSGIVITPKPEEHAIEISLDTTAENNMIEQCDTIC